MRRRARLVVAGGVVVLLRLAGATGLAKSPPAGPRAAPTPTPPGAVRVSAASPNETQEQRMERLRAAQPAGRVYDIAVETRGKPITIAGKAVQLPPDAFIESVVTNVTCGAGLVCGDVPAYNIRRGNSRIGVAVNSGRINAETVAPGEEGAFDFLRRAMG